MTLVQRRIVYVFFMAIFVVGAPLILLSASGFRYNFKKRQLQKTGIIFLEVKPKTVKAYLNGKLIKDKLPLRLDNLLPNEYRLRLEKDGYGPWEKAVRVYEGQTTSIQYPRLFKNNTLPYLLVAGDIVRALPNKNADIFLIVKKDSAGFVISKYNLRDGAQTEWMRSAREPLEVKWLAEENSVAVWFKDEIKIVGQNNQPARSLSGMIAKDSLATLQVDKYKSDFIYYTEAGYVYRYDLKSDKKEKLLAQPVNGFYIDGNSIFYIVNASLKKSSVVKYDLITGTSKELFLIESDSGYKLDDYTAGILTLSDAGEHKLLVHDEKANKQDIIQRADYYRWNNEKTEILFGNEWELWAYEVESRQNEEQYVLLNRLSTSIDDAIWYTVGTHVIYASQGEIGISENLPLNRYKNSLIQIESVKDLALDAKGETLFFAGKIGNQQGLFRLEIQ